MHTFSILSPPPLPTHTHVHVHLQSLHTPYVHLGMASKYRLLLPRTKFPIRVNPVTHELAIQQTANFDGLYKWQQQRNTDKVFTLHDGPPYANGEPHIGHALNKVLKDIINRYKLMRGYKLFYRPGWDCHGLPIELKACQDVGFKNSSPLEIRVKAAEFARATLQLQKEAFKRWGCLGDWDNPYITMDPEYEANQIGVFYRMFKKGCIYRGFKPVYWSPSSCTALAEAELEYYDHTSHAVYVLFPITNLPSVESKECSAYALVWTTTPWTLVANRAICYNSEHQYSLIRSKDKHGTSGLLLVGSACLQHLSNMLGDFQVVSTFPGSSLEGAEYSYSLECGRKRMPFLPGSHVTGSEGTGLVHTAPAHGLEDYTIGVQYGLDLQCNVDEDGKYTSQAGLGLENLFVLSEGNEAVISKFDDKGLLFQEHRYTHRYPYDWRTKKPVILRSTEQWFADVSTLKEEVKALLDGVTMHPSSAVKVLLSNLNSRDDWCISRQRSWGVPIPVFYHKESGDVLLTDETLTHIEGLIREQGSDCWWKLSISELLPPSMRPQAQYYNKGLDTMDVWFDSGSSWATVLRESGKVADMYLEGKDQHRGWFQSSLLTSIAAQGKAPYREVVTHGFVLDGNGVKMSKSLGNVISPDEIINKLGADSMRMWVISSDFTTDATLSEESLKQTNDLLLKVRNTCRFMLGNLSDFDPAKHMVPYPQLFCLDRFILHVLYDYCTRATQAYESLHFTQLHQLLLDVTPDYLSSFYFDAIKDRLYCDHPNSATRRSAQSTLYHLLQYLNKSIAPITPHLAEEIAQHCPFHFEQGLLVTRKGVGVDIT